MKPIEGKGFLGLMLTKLGTPYNEALELVEDLELACKKHGYKIVVTKVKQK